jgi:hypothetical protein
MPLAQREAAVAAVAEAAVAEAAEVAEGAAVKVEGAIER